MKVKEVLSFVVWFSSGLVLGALCMASPLLGLLATLIYLTCWCVVELWFAHRNFAKSRFAKDFSKACEDRRREEKVKSCA